MHRRELFSWLLETMSIIGLRQRSKELILLALDEAFMNPLTSGLDSELLSLSCVCFVVKLEGDFTSCIANFYQHVNLQFQSSSHTLLFYEGLLLSVVNKSFNALLTFSDVNAIIIRLLRSQLLISETIKSFMDELCIRSFVELEIGFDLLSFSFWCFFKYSKAKLHFLQLIEFVNFILTSCFGVDNLIKAETIRQIEQSAKSRSSLIPKLEANFWSYSITSEPK